MLFIVLKIFGKYFWFFGFGIIFVFIWLDVGDIVEVGVVGGNFGYVLMWVVVLVVVM